jgi:hypothetical protein
MYGEWDRNPPLQYELMICQPRYSELQYNIPPTGERCFNWRIQVDTETDPSCMSVIRSPLVPPSFTHPCYSCDKIVSIQILAAVLNTLFAQVVLTLRFVFFEFNSDRAVQITAE